MTYRLQSVKLGVKKRSGTAELVDGRDLIVARVRWSRTGYPRITAKWLASSAHARFRDYCEPQFESDVLELLFEKKSREK